MSTSAAQPRRRVSSEHRKHFESMLSDIERQIAHRFCGFKAELRQELTAEAVALSYVMFVALIQRGRLDRAYPTPLAMYGCRQALAGRRAGSPLNGADVTSVYCQKRRKVRVQRLQRFDPKRGAWQEILVEDRTANPADIAAMRIDFRSWLRSQSSRKQRIAETLAGGEKTGRVARMFHVSDGRISRLRREFRDSWREFQGEPAGAPA